MEKSGSLTKLAEALSKFQSQVSPVKKDASNPFYKSKYATLGGILEAIKQPLAHNGLSISQFPSSDQAELVSLKTVLMHTSGEYLIESFTMKPIKTDPQSVGSCIMYMRRYAIEAVLGIAREDEDDDGNHASVASTKTQQQVVAKPDAKSIPKEAKSVNSSAPHNNVKEESGTTTDVQSETEENTKLHPTPIGVLLNTLMNVLTIEELQIWWTTNQPAILALNAEQQAMIVRTKDTKKRFLMQPPEAQ